MAPTSLKISAAIICYNEADNIKECIESLLPIADEIICVDSYSKDKTVEIAKALGAKVILNPFEGHIQQKNFALSQTLHNMVISLDADERLDAELRASIQALKSIAFEPAYEMNRKNIFCNRWIRFGGWYPDRKVRLWDKSKGQWGGTNPHDKVVFNTDLNLIQLKGNIIHHSFKNRSEYPKQLSYFAEISATEYFKKGRRASAFIVFFNPIFTFIKSYILQLGFLDGSHGFFIAKEKARANYKKYKMLQDLSNSIS